jgi:hypothetical protein
MRLSRCILLAVIVLCAAPGLVHAKASSYSKAASGSKVLYLLLDDLGYNVNRLLTLQGLSAKPSSTQPDALIVLGATDFREPPRAIRWLGRGGLLVLAPPLYDESGHCKDFTFGSIMIRRVFRFDHEDSSRAINDPKIKMRAHACVTKPPGNATVLAKTDEGAIVYHVPHAGGTVLVLAHETMIQNMTLDRDDLAVILRRYFARRLPGGARISFLEEHRGGQIWRMLKRAHLLPLFFHGLFFLVLVYWKITPRFGDADPFEPARRRAFSEHARALGGLHQAVGASGYVLARLYDRFRQKLRLRPDKAGSAKTGLAQALSIQGQKERKALAQTLATRTRGDADEIESLLAQVQYAATDGSKDAKSAQRDYRLAVRLAELSRAAGLTAKKDSPKKDSAKKDSRPTETM